MHAYCRPSYSKTISFTPMTKVKPIGGIPILSRIADSLKPIWEIPEKFQISENPEEHLKPSIAVEVHEAAHTHSPEEALF